MLLEADALVKPSGIDLDDYPDPVAIAADLARQGWPTIAIRSRSKHPAHGGSDLPNHESAWLRTPLEVVNAWEETNCQFAAIPGVANADGLALVALDVDGDTDGLLDVLAEAGPEALAWAERTVKVQRPDVERRFHLWGTAPVLATGRLTDGLEWRGLGGYVMLPGSRHPDGELYQVVAGPYGDDDPDGKRFRVMSPLRVPEVLLEAVRARRGPAGDAHVPREAPSRSVGLK